MAHYFVCYYAVVMLCRHADATLLLPIFLRATIFADVCHMSYAAFRGCLLSRANGYGDTKVPLIFATPRADMRRRQSTQIACFVYTSVVRRQAGERVQERAR